MIAASPVDSVPLAIEADGVSKTYRNEPALQNLSLHVPIGSIYGLVGANGAGKTTTLRILATLEEPDTGTVRVAGVSTRSDPRGARSLVGYMPDYFGLYESLTASEYLNFWGAVHGLGSAQQDETSTELLELVDLSDKRDEPVERLSRGQQQRLGLARCLVHDPQILLLDEPSSGMDPRARLELREILQELSGLNKTVVISSQVLPELSVMCSHLGLIQSGEIMVEGTAAEVVEELTDRARVRICFANPSNAPLAMRFLSADPSCISTERKGENVIITDLRGGEADRARILAGLLQAEVQVTHYADDIDPWEDMMLRAEEATPGVES